MGQESVKKWIHIADDWTKEEQMEMLKYLIWLVMDNEGR